MSMIENLKLSKRGIHIYCVMCRDTILIKPGWTQTVKDVGLGFAWTGTV